MRLSQRAQKVSDSVTLKLNARVKQLQASGEKIFNLTAGEPDFSVLEKAKRAAIQAIEEDQNKYTPAPGVPKLRELAAEKTNAQHPELATPWKAENVVITNGAKQALVNTLLATINPNDEVIIQTPYWVSYPEMIKIADGTPKVLEAPFADGFKLKPEKLDAAITDQTRMVIINSPANPTGVVYSKEELQAFGQVIQKHVDSGRDLLVMSDEIYDRINFGNQPFCSFLNANPGLSDRTITINGMSKSAAMTGWRIGWSVSTLELAKSMTKLQSQMTSGINSIAQWASIASLETPEAEFSAQIETFKKRRDLALEILSKDGKMKVCVPDGAFYLFVGLPDSSAEKSSLNFSEALLNEKKVAVVPGASFGQEGFVRISVATDDETIQEGCRRIIEFLGI